MQRHLEELLCRHEFDGGLGFRDHNAHRADRDMAESVAAAVASCLGGGCPFDDEEETGCPIFGLYGEEE